VEQVRQSLHGLAVQAGERQESTERSTEALQTRVNEEAGGLEDAVDGLAGAADTATASFHALGSSLAQAGADTRSAHQEAQAALGSLAARCQTSQPELAGAVDELTAALGSAEQAVSEGQSLVEAGAKALGEAMKRLLGDAQARLAQTHSRLDALRAEQEKAVEAALSELEHDREELQQYVADSVQADVELAPEPHLRAVGTAATEMGQAAVEAMAKAIAADRDQLHEPLRELAERVEPLQARVAQVKEAAQSVGIAWP
jgi:chromosome segregation ATPase